MPQNQGNYNSTSNYWVLKGQYKTNLCVEFQGLKGHFLCLILMQFLMMHFNDTLHINSSVIGIGKTSRYWLRVHKLTVLLIKCQTLHSEEWWTFHMKNWFWNDYETPHCAVDKKDPIYSLAKCAFWQRFPSSSSLISRISDNKTVWPPSVSLLVNKRFWKLMMGPEVSFLDQPTNDIFIVSESMNSRLLLYNKAFESWRLFQRCFRYYLFTFVYLVW